MIQTGKSGKRGDVLSYRKDSFEGDELDRMRARQQRKKQGRPAAPTGDSYDLSPDQIEELDLDDYDTYESALKQELNRTIAQTKQEQKNRCPPFFCSHSCYSLI